MIPGNSTGKKSFTAPERCIKSIGLMLVAATFTRTSPGPRVRDSLQISTLPDRRIHASQQLSLAPSILLKVVKI
jgi:hypothetical protein